MTELISVIVPHYEDHAGLARCLAALSRQTLGARRFEIIIADNASAAPPLSIVSAHANARLVFETRRGAAHARNRALREAKGAILAFTDADCEPAPDWLEAGARALSEADLVGGAIEVCVADPDALTATEAFERVFAFRQRLYVRRKGFAATANLFATRRAAMAIGPFRDGVSEDVDWCRRGRALGFHLAFSVNASVRHPARRDWASLAAKWDRLTDERWRGFAPGARGRGAMWALMACATALSAIPHLAALAFTQRLTGWRARMQAALVLARIRKRRARRMLAQLGAREAEAAT